MTDWLKVLTFGLVKGFHPEPDKWYECECPNWIRRQWRSTDKGIYYFKGHTFLYRVECEHVSQQHDEAIVKCEMRLRRDR